MQTRRSQCPSLKIDPENLDQEEIEPEEQEKAEVLLTDDDDTEDLNQRRSVRIWSNKIKKELVTEQLPDEIDGWKIPSDEEEIEDGDDAHDSPFETEEKIEPHKLVRVRSKRGRKPKVEEKKEPR